MTLNESFELSLFLSATVLWIIYSIFTIIDAIQRSEAWDLDPDIPSGYELSLYYRLLPMLAMYLVVVILYWI